jgi:EAL domain-containing protein (putative c-di-GMP-specific phosphodiesterase class I)
VRLQQILGYEALSRDPQGKHNILALFRKYHAIGKLHELKCLCFRLQTKAAQEAGLERLFLNVDFTVLKNLDVPPKPPEMEVVLEISEGEALQDVENHLEVARKWRSGGYKFAIDDFGAGFVSLPFIARLVPDYIKLDRATIVQAVSSDQFKLVLQDLIHALRRTCTDGIIAEGIETQQELSVTKSLGIYLIQGYLFGKPQAWSELRTEGFPPPVQRQLKKAS